MRNGCSGCWTEGMKVTKMKAMNKKWSWRAITASAGVMFLGMFGTVLTVQLGRDAATLVSLAVMAAGFTVFAVTSAWLTHLDRRERARRSRPQD